jgi:hypothetical protein
MYYGQIPAELTSDDVLHPVSLVDGLWITHRKHSQYSSSTDEMNAQTFTTFNLENLRQSLD